MAGKLEKGRGQVQELRRLVGSADTPPEQVDWPAVHSCLDLLDSLLLESKSSEKSKKLLNTPEPAKERKKGNPIGNGHGRNGAKDFGGAEKHEVKHENLNRGGPCPSCVGGKVYPTGSPGVIVRLYAQPLITGDVYNLERLKCNCCSSIFTARPPEGVGDEKYDETVPAALAVSRFLAGVPSKRLEKFLAQFNIPLPHSTQWELLADASDALGPIFEELQRQAANCGNIHFDDSSMKVLELNRTLTERTGVHTTAVVADAPGKKIALFFTGEKHGGENAEKLLTKRLAGLPKPTLMTDALSRNHIADLEYIEANCLVHARRNFVQQLDKFPDSCKHLITELGKVYANEAEAKRLGLSDDSRMSYHQNHSGPIMGSLHGWAKNIVDNELEEPNSGLGKALNYLLKHWDKLTRFLDVPGCPLDNNVSERAIKRMVLYRKNSLFYRNENGSRAGDLFMSLIHTCELNGVPAYEYLVKVLRHSDHAALEPGSWLPWNYKSMLEPETG